MNVEFDEVGQIHKLIDVIIINWNSGNALYECLDSILKFDKECIGQIIVVDNNSTDGSERRVDGFKITRLIRAGENLGFSKACNLAAEYSVTKYLLLLNPDVKVFRGSISDAVAFMESVGARDIGIVGVKNVDEKGQIHRHCCRFPSSLSFVCQSLGLSRLWPQGFPGHFMSEWDHNEDREVDHVIGSYFLVRRELWQQLGGLDERFFVYLEDLDFSLRAHRQGWRTWYLSNAKIYHQGGGTSSQVKDLRLFYSLQSRISYSVKHFRPGGAIIVLACTVLIEPFCRVIWAVATHEWQAIGEIVRGYAALYKALPRLLKVAFRDLGEVH